MFLDVEGVTEMLLRLSLLTALYSLHHAVFVILGSIHAIFVVVTLFYIDLFLQKYCFSSQLYTYVQAN